MGIADHAQNSRTSIRMYWLLGRPPGVRHLVLEPALTTEADTQDEMIAELQANGVDWIVLAPNVKGDRDSEARAYRGADHLDRFIRERYEPLQSFGP